MSAAADRARDPRAQAEHEAKLATLAAVFSRLPERRRRRCSHPATGSSLTDTLVFAEAGDGSAWYEGVVVAGERDEHGQWLLDGAFTVFTIEEELISVDGSACLVEIQ